MSVALVESVHIGSAGAVSDIYHSDHEWLQAIAGNSNVVQHLAQASNRESIKVPYYVPSVWGGIKWPALLQKVNNSESVTMSWRHH